MHALPGEAAALSPTYPPWVSLTLLRAVQADHAVRAAHAVALQYCGSEEGALVSHAVHAVDVWSFAVGAVRGLLVQMGVCVHC